MDDRVKILLVDDQERNLEALEAILESPELVLVRALSADQALLALLQDEFAALVLDIKMPGVNGLELAQLIKGRKRNEHIPILFLTAHLLEERDVIRGYGAGAVDYLSKPANPEILRSKIAVFVDLFRKSRALTGANHALQLEIAERRKAQEALRVANDELESRVRDRTRDLVAANVALAESQERLRQALWAAEMGSWRVDLEGGLCTRDATLNQILGLPPLATACPMAEMYRFVVPDDLQNVTDCWRRALGGGGTYTTEFRIRRPDGSVRWVRDHGCHMSGSTGAGFVTGVILDITERREAEEALKEQNRDLDAAILERTKALEQSQERLRQAERLAAIGTLAAGLGHDMNNLLFPIRARLSALTESELSPSSASDVAAISEATGYLQQLAAGLRLLSVDPDRERDPSPIVDLGSWWRGAEGVFRAALPWGLELEGQCTSGLPPVAIHASQLTQSVYNLVQNAAEAITAAGTSCGHGRIWISAALVGPSTSVSDRKPMIELSVTDDGPGMSPEVAARCFEPYFSTKVRAISTGMGLAIVRGFIEDVGGQISVHSVPGQGTTFTLRLPVVPTIIAASRPQDGSDELRAAISIDNRRTRGVVVALLAAEGVAHVDWAGPGAPSANLWIVDSAASRLDRIAAFLAQGMNKQTLVLADPTVITQFTGGDAGAEPLSASARFLLGRRVRCLGREPAMGELHDALLGAIQSLGSPERGRVTVV